MPHLTCCQGNANENKSLLHSYWNSQMLTTSTGAGEELERPELAPSLEGVQPLRKLAGFLTHYTYSHHVVQQLSALVFTQRS